MDAKLKAKILERCLVERNIGSEEEMRGVNYENARLLPIIRELLACVEAMDGALKEYEPYCVIVTEPNAYSAQLDEFKEVWLAKQTRAEVAERLGRICASEK